MTPHRNASQLIISSLLLFVLYVTIDFLVHGVLIRAWFFDELDSVSGIGNDIAVLPLLLGMFWVSLAMALVLSILPQQPDPRITVVLIAIMGSAFIVPYHLINHAFFVSYPLEFVLLDSLISVAEFIVVGLIYSQIRFRAGSSL